MSGTLDDEIRAAQAIGIRFHASRGSMSVVSMSHTGIEVTFVPQGPRVDGSTGTPVIANVALAHAICKGRRSTCAPWRRRHELHGRPVDRADLLASITNG